ncbi:MAG: branched-chain amino acid ABC transporter permease [Xanthobacteraceae bacterium]|nr:MAG: branched-chain amino acid ABC transporter permease [Xanthobacteraceae bacterium]
MSFAIAVLLLQDGITNGAIYVLLAVALVLVFTVTRIVFIPQGDLVAFTGLTLTAFETGTVPGTVWILAAAAAIALAMDLMPLILRGRLDLAVRPLIEMGLIPGIIIALSLFAVPREASLLWKMAATLAVITALAPLMHRIVFQPLVSASPLILLIAAVAVHFGLTSLGLHFFGPEGVRTPGFTGPSISIFGFQFTQQSLGVIACSVLLSAGLYAFFSRALTGKALLAAAFNRRGAELIGVSAVGAGRRVALIAGLVGAISGLLIGPTTTLYYDSGFILGLKGLVGGIIGGLAGYPFAVAGALLVGVVEAFASFWASAYRDVIVFTLIIPVLFWRSMVAPHHEEETE